MNLKSLGGYLFFFGAGSIALDFVEMQFVLMSWIDNWGPTVGWSIRIGMAVAGAAIWLFSTAKAEPAATENA
jgi:hypothetical protein